MFQRIGITALIASTLFLASMAFAVEHPPQDHGGADLILAGGDVIWGVHTNIGTFSIPTSSTTVLVKAYDGSTTNGQGMVEIQAAKIDIQGALDASASGYTGGGGGGGGGGFSSVLGYLPYGGIGGTAPYGSGAFDGEDGQFGGFNAIPPPDNYGLGADGDGPWAGAAGFDLNGGYKGEGGNDDDTYDDSTLMGSGGAGMRGVAGRYELTGPSAGSGGDAGGRGGGVIRLIAAGELHLGPDAVISANGAFGQEGAPEVFHVGGDGGDVEPPLYALPVNFEGGGGAGGGILIDVSAAATINVEAGAAVNSIGAYNPAASAITAAGDAKALGTPAPANSGSIKLFYTGANPFGAATITGGYTPAFESAVREWMVY